MAAGTASAKQEAPGQGTTVEFSATRITGVPGMGSNREKLYVSNDRMRVESELPGMKTITLMDLRTGKGTVLMPQQRTAMEISGVPMGGLPGQEGQSFLQWSKGMGDNPCVGGSVYICQPQGTERVGGLSALKWRMVPRDGAPVGTKEMKVWISPQLGSGMPVRLESEDVFMELTHIHLGKQPDSLFQVPAGYRKVDNPLE